MRSTLATRVAVHRQRHSTPIIVTHMVAVQPGARTAEKAMGSIAPSIVALKAVARSKQHMTPTTALIMCVSIRDATMPKMVIAYTASCTMTKGVKEYDL